MQWCPFRSRETRKWSVALRSVFNRKVDCHTSQLKFDVKTDRPHMNPEIQDLWYKLTLKNLFTTKFVLLLITEAPLYGLFSGCSSTITNNRKYTIAMRSDECNIPHLFLHSCERSSEFSCKRTALAWSMYRGSGLGNLLLLKITTVHWRINSVYHKATTRWPPRNLTSRVSN